MEFLATVKQVANSTPQKYKYEAEDFHRAISKLCTLVGVKSTIEIHSYDLLEIKKDPSTGVAYGYIPRGFKEGNISSVNKQRPAEEVQEIKEKITETLYSPYQMQEV